MNKNQVAYVNNRFLSESGRLVSDVLKITNSLDIKGLLMTVDIEKNRFDNEVRKWIQILMKNPDSYVINVGKTTPYFKLVRGTKQGDSISTYLFIIAFEVVFAFIKPNLGIEGLQFFSYTFLYSVYADDTTFF